MGHRLDMKERLQVFKTEKIAKRLKLVQWEIGSNPTQTKTKILIPHWILVIHLSILFCISNSGYWGAYPSCHPQGERLDRLAVALIQRDRPLMLMGNLDSHINPTNCMGRTCKLFTEKSQPISEFKPGTCLPLSSANHCTTGVGKHFPDEFVVLKANSNSSSKLDNTYL